MEYLSYGPFIEWRIFHILNPLKTYPREEKRVSSFSNRFVDPRTDGQNFAACSALNVMLQDRVVSIKEAAAPPEIEPVHDKESNEGPIIPSEAVAVERLTVAGKVEAAEPSRRATASSASLKARSDPTLKVPNNSLSMGF